jgi:hypothetical protein
MAAEISPFVEANFGWPYGSSGWNDDMDANLVKFSYLFDRNIDGVVGSLPAIVNGKAYFLTLDNRLYFDVDGQRYSSPTPKWFVVTDRVSGQTYQFDGSALNAVDGPTSTQAANVTYQANITGSVSRTLPSKLREYISLRDFGAIGDGTLHPLSERFATLAAAQEVYPFATSLTQSIDYCAIVSGDAHCWSQRKTLRADEGVYVCDNGIDSLADWDFSGYAQLAPFPLEGDAKEFLRPGYKNLIPGAALLFVGTGVKSMTTQRVDAFSSFTYCVRTSRTGAIKRNLSIILDVDVYDAGGTLTAFGADNSADYDVGHIIDDAAQVLVDDVTVFGYFPLAGTVIRSVLGADDPDYCIFRGGSTMGRLGLSLIGSDTDDGFDSGLSGTQTFGLDIFTNDHHSRSPATAPTIYAAADTWRCIYIDGHTDASQADINGHFFHGGSIRSYVIHAVEVDEASQANFIGCIFESSNYAGVPFAETKQWLASSLTQDVGLESCRFSTDPGLLTSSFAGVMKGQLTIKNCPGLAIGAGLLVAEKDPSSTTAHWIKIGGGSGGSGDPAIQMGSGSATTSTVGWSIRKDINVSDLLDFRYAGTSVFSVDTTGAIGRLVLRKATLTIAAGVITLTGLSNYNIDTEAAAATDDLDTINGGVAGQILYINSTVTARDVNVTEVGNIRLNAAGVFLLSHPQDSLVLRYDGTTWNEISRSDNTA